MSRMQAQTAALNPVQTSSLSSEIWLLSKQPKKELKQNDIYQVFGVLICASCVVQPQEQMADYSEL